MAEFLLALIVDTVFCTTGYLLVSIFRKKNAANKKPERTNGVFWFYSFVGLTFWMFIAFLLIIFFVQGA